MSRNVVPGEKTLTSVIEQIEICVEEERYV